MTIFYDRKSLRLKGFDYTNYASYFVTICSYERKFLFGTVINNEVQLNQNGQIVNIELNNLPNYYDNIYMHKYVVMPNHVHLLLSIISQDLVDLAEGNIPQLNTSSLSQIVRHFKAGVTRAVNLNCQSVVKNNIWHKSFHDRIVRNEQEFELFYNYIIINPAKWNDDCHNPENVEYRKWN